MLFANICFYICNVVEGIRAMQGCNPQAINDNSISKLWGFGLVLPPTFKKVLNLLIPKLTTMETNSNQVVFSCNWNFKLNCNIFTTIRKCNDFNLAKYQKGRLMHVMLKDQDLGEVIIQNVWRVKFGKIPQFVVEQDTGYSYENAIGIFENLMHKTANELLESDVLLILFRKTLKP